MDAATFFTSLLTCHHFLTSALNRRNLLRHINNLPGIKLGLEEQHTPQLLREFRRRAAESGVGAGVLAGRCIWEKGRGRSLGTAVFAKRMGADPPLMATGE